MNRNSCSCARRRGGYGALSSLNFRGFNRAASSDSCCLSQSDCPDCTTCAGSPLYYSGCCGPVSTSCSGVCVSGQNCCGNGYSASSYNNCGCNSCGSCNNCNNCNSCNNCNNCNSCNSCGSASWYDIPLSRASCRQISCDSCYSRDSWKGRDHWDGRHGRSGCDKCDDHDDWNRRDSRHGRSGCDKCSDHDDWDGRDGYKGKGGCDKCNDKHDGYYSNSYKNASAHGIFTALCPINVCHGETISLEMESGETECFREKDGCIFIKESGEYQVHYSLNVPAGVNASSNLALSLDGRRVFHTAAPVDTCSDGANHRYTGHGVITARRGQSLSVVADGGLEIPVSSGEYPALQLTIIKLG